jgi:hypothetical protein
VRRGCISLGNIKCDLCHRTIRYPERYLLDEEIKGRNQIICLDCCQEKGLLKAETDKEDAESLFNLSNE